MRYFVLLDGKWREVVGHHGLSLRRMRLDSPAPETFDGHAWRLRSGENVVLYTPQGTAPTVRMVEALGDMIDSKQPIPRA